MYARDSILIHYPHSPWALIDLGFRNLGLWAKVIGYHTTSKSMRSATGKSPTILGCALQGDENPNKLRTKDSPSVSWEFPTGKVVILVGVPYIKGPNLYMSYGCIYHLKLFRSFVHKQYPGLRVWEPRVGMGFQDQFFDIFSRGAKSISFRPSIVPPQNFQN